MSAGWIKVLEPIDKRVSFIRAISYETASGRFAARIHRGFGVHEGCLNIPKVFVLGRIWYFETQDLRDAFVNNKLKRWGAIEC